MNKKRLLLILFTAAICTITLASCDDDSTGGNQTEPTAFNIKVTNVGPVKPVLKSGTFSSPGPGDLGPDAPALFPGESASFTFNAPSSTLPPIGGTGLHLNLATMFVQSNDLFYGFKPEGLDLYDEQGNPVGANGAQDVTDQIFLYDAGTEMDTAPGTGPDQKPAQDPMVTNQGSKEDEDVSLVSEAATNDFEYPDKKDVIKVTIEHTGDTQFTVTISNVSQPGTINSQRAGGSVPLSPGAWAVYEDKLPFRLFKTGEKASKGIELIAEDGFPADKIADGSINTPVDMGVADAVAQVTGVTTPLSPPVIASYNGGFQLFSVDEKAGPGIETVAEDGFPASMLGGNALPPDPERALVDILEKRDEVTSAGAAPNTNGNAAALEPAPDGDGESGSFEVMAQPGDHLNFVSMYVQSNDFFYSFGPEGLSLFDQNGTPLSGDVTDQIVLYDAGTEVDEEPGVGLSQKLRQGSTAEDVGEDENGVIQVVVGTGKDGGTNDEFSYPPSANIIKVTVTPMQPDVQQ